MTQERRHNIPVIRELLLNAFALEELESLFAFAMNRHLRPVAAEFAPGDGKPDMVGKAVAYCQSRFLLDELLAEVKEANPRAYARFEDRLYDAALTRGASALILPLPADLPDFGGRDAQIDQLCAALHRVRAGLDQERAGLDRDRAGLDRERAGLDQERAGLDQEPAGIVSIHGTCGIGKTVLAVHVAQLLVHRGRYHDIQLFIDLKSADPAPVHPVEALEALLNAVLGAEPGRPHDLDSLAALWRQAIRGKDALLILDNAADAAQVRPLLPHSTSCAVLVTSRQRFVLPGAVRLDLEPMQPGEARTLLQELAPHLDTGGADIIAASCGCVPLGLRLAGSYLRLNDDVAPEGYADMLANERTRWARLSSPGDPDLELAAAISLCGAQLDAVLRRAWMLLALFPAPFDLAAAAALWGDVREGAQFRPMADDLWEELREGEGFDAEEWDDDRVSALRKLLEMLAGPSGSRATVEAREECEAKACLQALCSRSLLSYDRESDRYQQHDLIRLAAARDLETWPAQAVETARLRLALHYQGVARAAGARYEQGGEGVRQGLASFALDWPHIRAGQAWAASRAGGSGEAAWLCSDYADAAAALLSLRLHPRDWIAWLEAATRAARRLGDRRAEGNHLVRLGKAHRDLGKLEEAVDYYQQAVSVARQAGDRRSEGAWLANLGQVYHDQGLTAPARDSWTQALALLEAVEDPRAQSVRRSLSELED